MNAMVSMMRGKMIVCLFCLAASAAQAAHDEFYDWRCPYSPDGTCTPRRSTYGHYPTKWSRWPGVSDADYESSLPSSDLSAPPDSAETGPRISPTDLLPPYDPSSLDSAPTPPGGDGSPPPLTPEADQRPDILTPPGEDVMDELLPDDEPKQPEPAPGPPAEPDSELLPGSTPKPNPEPTPERAPESGKPFEDDPFKDEPLFNDEAPAPPSGTKRSGIDSGPDGASPNQPAMRSVPARLPSAQRNGNLPKSRLSRAATSDPRPMPGVPAAGKSPTSARSRNPLRNSSAPNQIVADDVVVPTKWQEPVAVQPEPERGWRVNPLRSR